MGAFYWAFIYLFGVVLRSNWIIFLKAINPEYNFINASLMKKLIFNYLSDFLDVNEFFYFLL